MSTSAIAVHVPGGFGAPAGGGGQDPRKPGGEAPGRAHDIGRRNNVIAKALLAYSKSSASLGIEDCFNISTSWCSGFITTLGGAETGAS